MRQLAERWQLAPKTISARWPAWVKEHGLVVMRIAGNGRNLRFSLVGIQKVEAKWAIVEEME